MDCSAKKRIIWALALLVCFHTANNYAIAASNKAPLYHNSGDHLVNQNIQFQEISEWEWHANFFAGRYPAILTILLYPYYWAAGINQTSVIMSNALFLAILVASVYGIGKRLHSCKAGLLAAFTVTVFPQVFGLSRDYDMRFHLAAMVCLSIYLMLRSDGFTRTWYSLLFGMAAGFGAGIKPEFSLFVIGPFIGIIARSMHKEISKGRQFLPALLKNLGVSLAGFMLVYIINGGLNPYSLQHSLYAISPYKDSVSPDALFYVKSLVGIQVLHYFSALLIAAIAYAILRRRYSLLLTWFFVPLLFFTVVAYANPSIIFMVSAMPAVALLISVFICSARSANLRKTMAYTVILVGLAQFFVISYVPTAYPGISRVNRALGITNIQPNLPQDFLDYDGMSFPAQTQYIGFLHAYRHDWGINSVSSMISYEAAGNGTHVTVIVIDSAVNHVIAQPLRYGLYLQGIRNAEVIPIEDYDFQRPAGYRGSVNPRELLADADYFVLTDVTPQMKSAQEMAAGIRKTHRHAGDTLLPNGILISVYKNSFK
ncbi:MAG: glycosyltransferase family 39 protein [archaeon]